MLYSDGIPEAMNTGGELFGEERLEDAIRAVSKDGVGPEEYPPRVAEAIMGAVERFVGKEPRSDDITLMVVYRHPVD